MANRDLTPWRRHGVQPMQGYPRDPFASFRREIDRLFEDFFAPGESRSFAAPALAQGVVSPSIDVHETDQAYTVTAELPGLDAKDIEIHLDDNALTLRGEKRSEREEDEGGRRYSERSYGRFERTIPFASEVDADRVEASFENGLLKVALPKNPRARDTSRRIRIGGGGPQGKGQAPPAKGGPDV
jgi:HSP20 family protein